MFLEAILTLVLAGVVYLRVSNPGKKKFPPGPKRWPILGNIPNIAVLDPKYPHLAMETLAKTYGNVMGLGFGVHEACILSSYESIKEILTREETSDRFRFTFVTDRSFHKSLGIIWSEGSMWSKMRKFTVKGLREFGFGKQKSMDVIVREDIEELTSYLKELAEKNSGEVEVDPHHFAGSIINILWCLVAGYRFPIGDPIVRGILDHGNRMAEIVGPANVYNALPFLRHLLPNWTNHATHLISHKEYQDFVKVMIEKAKVVRAARQDNEPENFIEVFLDEIVKNSGDPNTIFTEEQLILTLMDLFLAGSETTGTAMVWTILFLVLNPKVQSKLRDEVQQVCGSGPINIQDFQKMPYLKATIYESMRLSNFVPIGPPRTVLNDIPYKDFKIKKGCILMSNLTPIFNDKAYWGDPQVFRPERFLDGSGTKVINIERVSLIFGLGKRGCMGESFVWNVLPMYLANLVRTFTMEEIPGRKPTMKDPHPACTLLPQRYSIKLNWD